MMSTLTIHALDPEVERLVRSKARKEQKSLNRTLKELLAQSVGNTQAAPVDHGPDFAEFANVWSDEDQREFDAATADFERVDVEDWQ